MPCRAAVAEAARVAAAEAAFTQETAAEAASTAASAVLPASLSVQLETATAAAAEVVWWEVERREVGPPQLPPRLNHSEGSRSSKVSHLILRPLRAR